ncbi:hypothetical protein [Natrinema sp. 1APR25-10V2]|uniref:hypothetical protein n=1 Tax=Natrinema sp. 1APR25-10V2 TaxID=2951081 RepID=UPI00287488EA|nr:hypothetical protein [Natrinema sp. 1APR25-10V2]MDS0476848.1 hypothetical protein [Natrinema sp. 1APR25-10V2]
MFPRASTYAKVGLVLVAVIGLLAAGASWSVVQPEQDGVSHLNVSSLQSYVPADFLQVSGDTIEGTLNMDSNLLTGISDLRQASGVSTTAIQNDAATDIARFKDGGNVEIPNGNVSTNGSVIIDDKTGDGWTEGLWFTSSGNGDIGGVYGEYDEAGTGQIYGWIAADSSSVDSENGHYAWRAYDNGNFVIPNGNIEISESSNVDSSLSKDSSATIIGDEISSRTDNSVQELLTLHQPNTQDASKGSTFGVGLSFYENSGSNYPRTRVDFRTTGRSTDDSDTNLRVMSLKDTGDVVIPNGQLEAADIISNASYPTISIVHKGLSGDQGSWYWGVPGGSWGDTSTGNLYLYSMQNDAHQIVFKNNGDVDIPNGNLVMGGARAIQESTTNAQINFLNTENGKYGINTPGGGSGAWTFWDSANGQDIAIFNEGGDVNIPNGDLNVSNGKVTLGGADNRYRLNVDKNIQVGDTNGQGFRAGRPMGVFENDWLSSYAGLNIGYYNSTHWKIDGDGSNAGAGMMASSISGGDIRFYTWATTGPGEDRFIDNDDLSNREAIRILPGGHLDVRGDDIRQVDALQDGTGTDTIRFDGNDNVEVPNGELTINSDSTGTATTVNQAGIGDLFEIQNGGTTVLDVQNGNSFGGREAVLRAFDDSQSSTSTTTVDATDNVGKYASVAVGSDGLARIAYIDVTNSNLMFARCKNTDCTDTTITTVDTGGSGPVLESGTDIVLDGDDNAYISYVGENDGENEEYMKLAECTNEDCTTNNRQFVEAVGIGNGEADTAVDLAPNGNPRMAVNDQGGQESLVYVKCTNADCSSNTKTTVDADTANSLNVAMAVNGSDHAHLAYLDESPADHQFNYVECTADDCSSSNIQALITADDAAAGMALTLNGSSRARISYLDEANSDLEYIRCDSSDCSSNSGIQTIETSVGAGGYTDIVLTSGGLPRISYQHGGNGELTLAECSSDSCGSPTLTDIDTTGTTGLYTGIGRDSGDVVMIAYYRSDTGDLKFAKVTAAAGGGGVFMRLQGEPTQNNAVLRLGPRQKVGSTKTYLAANPSSAPGNFLDFQVGDTSQFSVDGSGNLDMNGNDINNVGTCSGCDLAETMDAEDRFENGSIVAVSDTENNTVQLSNEAYDTDVVGAVSTSPVINMGGSDGGINFGDATRKNLSTGDAEVPVGLAGVVPVKVNDQNGAIQRGDPIVASDTPGEGMRGDPDDAAFSSLAIIGKTMEPLHGSSGVITVLVS